MRRGFSGKSASSCSTAGAGGNGSEHARHLVFITSGLRTGGAESMLLKLMERLDRRRLKPLVVSLTGEGAYAARLRDLGIAVVSVNAGVLGLARAVLFVRSLLKHAESPIIQGWMYHGNVIATIAHLAAGKRGSLVWSVRHSLHDISRESRAIRLIIRFSAKLSRLVKCCIYPSVEARKQHRDAGFSDEMGFVIPNGFDVQSFLPPTQTQKLEARRVLGLAAGDCVIAHLGRLHPMKDHGGLLCAVSLAARETPRLKLVMAGAGVSWDSSVLSEQIHALGLRDRVQLLGELSDVRPVLAAADMFCLSSAWGEAFPNVIGEAMAMGLPCVATDVGDCRSIVGSCGVIVQPADPEALAAALRTVATTPVQQRSELGRAARRRVVQHYSIDAVATAYERCYASM